MHIHLDPVGGIAGDMFVAALLDLCPELGDTAIAAVRAAGLDEHIGLAHLPYSDGILSGSRFVVSPPPAAQARAERPAQVDPIEHERHDHDHHDHHDHEHADHPHQHVHWSSLRQRLRNSALPTAVATIAVDIFQHLAEAEARVHDKAVDDVTFHEVGAWDSIADIVAAAAVIESLSPCTWSCGAIPLGSGRVKSQHGLLPVPAPATVLLLEGLRCLDDGYGGERVTPTGAAIVRYLNPGDGPGVLARRLLGSGYGFGTRRFTGMSNVLRALRFDDTQASTPDSDRVVVLNFEIDDQTGEDLAVGLDHLRAHAGVIDVAQAALIGKRGRLLTGVQVLARPEALEAVTAACFRETTTLGIRVKSSERIILRRHEDRAADGTRVKLAERDQSASAKAEIADLAGDQGHEQRQRRRRTAETEVLARQVPHGD